MTPERRRKRWADSLPTSQTIVQNHWHVYAASSNNCRRINVHQTDVVFKHACALGCEGIVSKRLGSRYRSGRSNDWLKMKGPERVGGETRGGRRLGQERTKAKHRRLKGDTRARTHKRGHWPNVRSWGEPDTPGWRE